LVKCRFVHILAGFIAQAFLTMCHSHHHPSLRRS
jgi:hypothetical protein